MTPKPNKILIALYLRNLLRALEEKALFESEMRKLGVQPMGKHLRIN